MLLDEPFCLFEVVVLQSSPIAIRHGAGIKGECRCCFRGLPGLQAPCCSAHTPPSGAGAAPEKVNPVPQPQGAQDALGDVRRAEVAELG